MNKYDAKYWDKIKIGSIIQLDDQQTIEYLMEQGVTGVEHGADFETARIKNISLQDDLFRLKIVYMQLDEILWYLVIKFIGDEIQLKVYYQPDDFECGNREDMMADNQYLFESPKDENDFKFDDLVFAKVIEEGDIKYLSEGTFYGSSVESGKKDFAAIVEFKTESECENPDILVIELSNVKVEEQYDEDDNRVADKINIDSCNSYIMFLQGCSVIMNDVEVLN